MDGEPIEAANEDAGRALEKKVHEELLAARKTAEGLSPNAMSRYTTIVALLGDGDPAVAFARLQARILETLELGDDVIPIEAAAYSLGFASHHKTHLDRLVAFGIERGYEARQARRYSDRGVAQLASLICSNWVVHAVPSVEIYLTEQSDHSFAFTVRTRRQRFVDMHTLRIRQHTEGGGLQPLPGLPAFATVPNPADDTDPEALWITEQLERPAHIPAARPGTPGVAIRVDWQGEIWPRFSITTVGAIHASTVVTSQTLGNTAQVTVERLG